MLRYFVLAIAFVAGGGWAIWYLLVPENSAPRRYALGELNGESLGSLQVPFGWEPSRIESNETSVETYFRVPGDEYIDRPTVWVKASPLQDDASEDGSANASLQQPNGSGNNESELTPGRLLVSSASGERFFDRARRLEWQRNTTGERRVIDVRLRFPFAIEMSFTDSTDDPHFETTIIEIVDSYSVNASVPFYADELLSSKSGKTQEIAFRMSDSSRLSRAVWAVGSLLLLFGLLYAQRLGSDSTSDSEFRAASSALSSDGFEIGSTRRMPSETLKLDEDVIDDSDATDIGALTARRESENEEPLAGGAAEAGMLSQSETLRREQRAGDRGGTIPVSDGFTGMHTVENESNGGSVSHSEDDEETPLAAGRGAADDSALLASDTRAAMMLALSERFEAADLSSAEAFRAMAIFLEGREFSGFHSIGALLDAMNDIQKGRPTDGALEAAWNSAVMKALNSEDQA